MNLVNRKILNKVESVIVKKGLISSGDKVLVAFSGGSDSVFLLHILNALREKYGYKLGAAHLNHSLRDEADSEELFAEQLCHKLGIEFFSRKVDIEKISKSEKISEETAGRKERYAFFEELKNEHGFTKIATAHHRDDNAETILMHFIRGSGTRGLSGIEYMRGELIRPLLELSKSEILKACEDENWEYMTDKTNFISDYRRNKVRLELIPVIEEYNPGFSDVITSNGILFSEDDDFINSYARDIYNKNIKNNGIEKTLIDDLPKAVSRRIIQLMYKNVAEIEQNLSQKYVSALLELSGNGKELSLPGGLIARLSNGVISISLKEPETEKFSFKFEVGEWVYIPQKGKSWLVRKATAEDKKVFCLPEDAVLEVRSRRDGDIFFPIGMTGKKTLSNFFTDKKIPRTERDKIPVLTANGEVVCIDGVHFDRRFYNLDTNFNRYCLEISSKKC